MTDNKIFTVNIEKYKTNKCKCPICSEKGSPNTVVTCSNGGKILIIPKTFKDNIKRALNSLENIND